MNLNNFHRQHNDIYEQVDKINDLVNSSDMEEQFLEISSAINSLAGKLQIHLNSEDKYLYPNLLTNEKVSQLAQKYIDEMGGILEEFTAYKDKFNTKSKLAANKSNLARETKVILDKIVFRMNKEENELYKLI